MSKGAHIAPFLHSIPSRGMDANVCTDVILGKIIIKKNAMIASDIIFGFYTRQGFEVQSLLLVSSLRKFGGANSDLPVWVFYPAGLPLNPSTLTKLENLGSTCFPFEINETLLKFPFAGKTIAAAEAEGLAEQRNALLAWHDRTGMIQQAPDAFRLPDGVALGFRPTDIANIGAPFDAPLPPFWKEICTCFDITPEDLPPITTCIDRKTCYLYINAGLLVVDPRRKILRSWAKGLRETYNLPQFTGFYHENSAYAVFMHQAVLTAVAAKETVPEERRILPDGYLFSIDNFFDYPPEFRPGSLDEIITGRFHEFFSFKDWENKIIASDALIAWFYEQLRDGPYWPGNAA